MRIEKLNKTLNLHYFGLQTFFLLSLENSTCSKYIKFYERMPKCFKIIIYLCFRIQFKNASILSGQRLFDLGTRSLYSGARLIFPQLLKNIQYIASIVHSPK